MKNLLLFLGVAVWTTSCATLSDPEPVSITASVADTRQAQLADATARELAHLARFDPDRIDAVEPELRALAAALLGSELNAGDDSAVMPDLGDLPPPPTDFDQAASLRHGIHLASYRLEANAREGWAALQNRHADTLADREARLEQANIPGQGAFLRLKAGPYDSRSAAEAACAPMQAAGAYCVPVDFSGMPLADSE